MALYAKLRIDNKQVQASILLYYTRFNLRPTMMVNFDLTVFGPIDKYDNIKCSLFRTKINEDDENSDLWGFFRILYITENIRNKNKDIFLIFYAFYSFRLLLYIWI